MEIEPTPNDEVQSEAVSEDIVETAEALATPTSGRWWAIGTTVMAMAIVGVLAVTQMRMLNSLDDARTDIAALESQIASVGDSVDDLATDVASVADDITQAAAAAPSVNNGSSSPLTEPSNAAPAGYLPRYDSQSPDQAIGMTLGTIEGIDAYSEETISFDPADGTKRVWMVWAHWCPFCQQELPELSGWYPGAEDQYTTELVTITTSINPERGNPLDPYLDEQQFPFPVIVDPESALALQTGVSAFPFWLVTDGDGEVLLRVTGLLQLEQVISLFDQLEDLGA